MSTIKNIIFDFGGVIFDSDIRYFYRSVFESEEAMEHFLNTVLPGTFKSSWNTTSDTPTMIEKLSRLHPEYADKIAMLDPNGRYTSVAGLVPGMKDLLQTLAQKYPLFGLTNWEGDSYDGNARRYPEIISLLQGVVVSGKVGLKKPDPRIFTLALGTFGILPHETLFIDDRAHNAYAARVQGMQAIHFESAATLREDLAAYGLL